MGVDDELRLRHLADVQATISRLSQNSFAVRGWAVTLVSFVLAILGTRAQGPSAVILGVIPIAVIFWFLDAYYLRQERLFRRLYTAVGSSIAADERGEPEQPAVPLFDMSVDAYSADAPSLIATLLTWHVVAIPGILSTVACIYAALVA
ncbi:hypothetical protein AB0M47_07815 [Hamadaea sp. NPDC051192]|uniref:hypothetical protein n=1 Tax=Hamadaea sp. NPDC051192 TaxID=3154940 RepID=UPI0034363826